MRMRISKNLAKQIETIFHKSGYKVRYEKGRFRGGFCIVIRERIIVINRYFPLETQVLLLMRLLKELPIETTKLNEKELNLLTEIRTKSN